MYNKPYHLGDKEKYTRNFWRLAADIVVLEEKSTWEKFIDLLKRLLPFKKYV